MFRFPIAIKIANVLVYFFLLGLNVKVYFIDKPDDDGNDLKEKNYCDRPTYFSPAPFAYLVWSIIYVLLFGFIIYQWFNRANEVVVDAIGWHFTFIGLWNSASVALCKTGHPILAWIAVIFTCLQVSTVYYNIRYKYPAEGFNDTIWIHMPFSLYHAWIFVLGVVGAFVAFPPKTTDKDPNVLFTILSIIGLLILEGTAVGYIELGKGDLVGSLVIAWSMAAIAVEQREHAWIYWSAVVLTVITLIYSVKPFLLRLYRQGSLRGGEGAPLLS